EGTPAEDFVARLVEYAPASLVVLLASRRQPRFNLSRRRIEGRLTELAAHDLRFRSWEVERLFKDVYRSPLPPEEAAEVTSRTEGWPAVLQLFHLATTGKTAARRRETLGALSTRSRLVREYLTQNVLEELPDDLRRFLLDTCVLPRLSGPLCDALLGRTGSQRLLEQIESRQLLLASLDDGSFRYHEVLRSYLESVLVAEVGEPETWARYRRAGRMLEDAAAYTDAIRAYSRAEDDQAIGRLLRDRGEVVGSEPGAWIETLPRGIVASDPWLLLAQARRHLACGRVADALHGYRSAEGAFGPVGAAVEAHDERMALGGWLEPMSPPGDDGLSLLREATRRDPLGASTRARHLGGPGSTLAAGLAALLAGHVRDAERLLAEAEREVGASPRLVAMASFARAVAQAFAGQRPVERLVAAYETFEELGQPWLAQLCQVVLEAVEPETQRPPGPAASDGGWGRAVAAVLRAGIAASPGESAELGAAAAVFRGAGARVLEAWASALEALALAGDGDPAATVTGSTAERLARTTGARGAAVMAYRALALTDPGPRANHGALAAAIAQECGLRAAAASSGAADGSRPSMVVRCFGAFTMEVQGELLDLQGVKPRARSLLRLLVVHHGRLLHWEALVEALWPETSPAAGKRSLQVAVSAIRQLVEPGSSPDSSFLTRVGDAYCLTLPDDAHLDIVAFEARNQQSRDAEARGDEGAAVAAMTEALELYRGDLLEEEGPAEWVVKARDHFRATAADVAERLAGAHVAAAAYGAAVRTCQRGLEIDRYRDRLWRLLVASHRESGDQANAGRAARDYAAILLELGVVAAPAG
ncbi:MAG TPA: BTAD domain-containing putative transcriptional regulator, partial [Acidimicrobiales bacterium]